MSGSGWHLVFATDPDGAFVEPRSRARVLAAPVLVHLAAQARGRTPLPVDVEHRRALGEQSPTVAWVVDWHATRDGHELWASVDWTPQGLHTLHGAPGGGRWSWSLEAQRAPTRLEGPLGADVREVLSRIDGVTLTRSPAIAGLPPVEPPRTAALLGMPARAARRELGLEPGGYLAAYVEPHGVRVLP